MTRRPSLSEGEIRLNRLRRRLGLILGPAAFVAILAAPLDLSGPAHRLAAIAALTVVFWITEAIPLAVAALLGPSLAVVFRVAPAEAAFASFAHPLIFLFLGGFLLAEGLSAQGFDRRAALWLMARRVIAGSPARAAAAIAIIAFGFSMWISNTATTAMMIPIALGLRHTMARALPDDPKLQRSLDRYAGGMCLFMAYAASIGGVSTPIGTGPNVLAMGFLNEVLGVQIDFLQWMSFALPTALVFLVILLLASKWWFPPPVEHIDGLTDEVQGELRALGPLGRGERLALGAFLLAVVGWLSPSLIELGLGPDHPAARWARSGLHEGVVALVCASVLFVLPGDRAGRPILTWERAHAIDWGTLLLLGGGIALGKLMFDTGLARAIGEAVLSAAGPLAARPWGLLAAATLLVIFMTEITSNTATTGMMLPVLVALAQASGIDPLPTAICVTMAASFAFMLPVSTPPNAMAYGTGMVRIDTMIRVGFRLDLLGYGLIVVIGLTLLPVILPMLS